MVSLDDFGELLADQVAVVKARRQGARDARAKERQAAQYRDDLEEVRIERELERAQRRAADQSSGGGGNDEATQKALADLQAALVTRRELNAASDALRERDTAADELEAHADAHADNAWRAVDTYVFFRTTPEMARGSSPTYRAPTGPALRRDDHRKPLMDVRDLMVGLAGVLFDHEALDAQYSKVLQREGGSPDQPVKGLPASIPALQASWSARDVEVFTRVPETKLYFAFRVVDEDRDDLLSLDQLAQLVTRLLRTGHIKPESVLRHKLNNSPNKMQRRQQEEDARNSVVQSPSRGSTGKPTAASSAAASPAAPIAALALDPPTSTPLLPYEYEMASAEDIAYDYWQHITQRRRIEALKQLQQDRANADAAAAASSASASSSATPAPLPLPLPLPAALDPCPVFSPGSSSFRVSWPEFLEASRHFSSSSRTIAFWYLHDTLPNGAPLGSFAKWRRKWRLRLDDQWSRVLTKRETEQLDKSILIMLASS